MTHTREDSPVLRANRAKAEKTGQRVEDLRDDGRWHDITDAGSAGGGKDGQRRPRAISDAEYARRYRQTFTEMLPKAANHLDTLPHPYGKLECTCQWCDNDNPCREECIDACSVHGSTD